MLRGQPTDLDQAEKLFHLVLKSSEQNQTQSEARYELARLLNGQGKHSAAASILQPLADAVMKDGKTSIPEILILYPHLLIQTKDYEQATDTDSDLQQTKV